MEKTEEYYFDQTPESVCKELIKEIPFENGDNVLEPFKNI